MARDLPVEVVQSIVVAYSSVSNSAQLAALARVSPTFRSQVQQQLLVDLDIRSTSSARLVLDGLERDNSVGRQARSLTVGRGARKRLQTTGRGKKKQEEWVEDAVTEENLVKLCAKLPELEAVHLHEPRFTSLRRRQLGCLSSLSRLSTLTISGRSANPFSLPAVGQLVLTLPRLQHLALRNLSCPSSSVANLSFPTCNLVSFALFSSPEMTDKQLFWLLRSSINAETLRSLAFDVSPTLRPSTLYPVRWAPIRTTDIYCTSEQEGMVEHLPRHCPSLRQYTFRTYRRVNPLLLLKSCTVFRTVEEVVDASDSGAGLQLLYLAAALLEQGDTATTIRRIRFSRQKRRDEGMRLLRAVCRLKDIEFSFFDVERQGDDLYIPDEFSSLRRVKL